MHCHCNWTPLFVAFVCTLYSFMIVICFYCDEVCKLFSIPAVIVASVALELLPTIVWVSSASGWPSSAAPVLRLVVLVRGMVASRSAVVVVESLTAVVVVSLGRVVGLVGRLMVVLVVCSLGVSAVVVSPVVVVALRAAVRLVGALKACEGMLAWHGVWFRQDVV